MRYNGSRGAGPEITRTQEEARAIAEKARREALEPGASFDAIVARYSDSPEKNGVLPPFGPFAYPAEFTAAVESAEIDALSEVVETQDGFHVIKRLAPSRK